MNISKDGLEVGAIICGFGATLWHIFEVKTSILDAINKTRIDALSAVVALKDDTKTITNDLDKRITRLETLVDREPSAGRFEK